MSDDYGYSRYGSDDLRFGIVCDRSAPGSDTNIVMRWNMYASGPGQFEVAGCEGVSPTLRLRTFTTYKFVQNDTSNWYHPIGFAFEPGGDHNDCPVNTDPNLRRGGIQVQNLECRDQVQSCQLWAREGQCDQEKSREFMHRQCRESCNLCQCPELQADMVSYYLEGRPIRDDMSGFGACGLELPRCPSSAISHAQHHPNISPNLVSLYVFLSVDATPRRHQDVTPMSRSSVTRRTSGTSAAAMVQKCSS